MQNLIDIEITDADLAAIDAAITTLEQKLFAKLIDLEPESRASLVKMGQKSEAFCRQALVVGRTNVARLPADTVTALTAAEKDLAALDKLRPRFTRLQQASELIDDSALALGSDVIQAGLSIYGVLQVLGATGAGLEDLKRQMGARFARGPKKPASDATGTHPGGPVSPTK